MMRLPLLSLALAASAAALLAGDQRLFYSREFPGSTPAYFQVTVTKAGDTEYKEAPDDDLPIKFKLDADSVQEVWGLAEKLGFFKTPLASPAKVAFMGTKTFRLENGGEKTEVKYNYSESKDAQALQDWFERMAESAQHRIELERTAKYDRLGVVNALTLLESALERDRIVAPEQFLPLLDRIIANENFMHAARARASEIAEGIRAMKPQQ
ncbi:MAG TPA: hypothetical protein VML19_14335 [Verrucomicrobiae bacterium]|nr:hypothetical protein [Verrucomicrobiae bacterium]